MGKNLTTTPNKLDDRLIFKLGKTKTKRNHYTTIKSIKTITKY